MNSSIRLAVGLGVAGLAALGVGAWYCLRRWRRKDPAELERLRRLEVNQGGRITAARVVEVREAKARQRMSRLVFYTYEVAGVTYDAAQDIFGIPGLNLRTVDLAGQTASIKYDTKKPANSIIACEEWSGLPDFRTPSPARSAKNKEQAPPSLRTAPKGSAEG